MRFLVAALLTSATSASPASAAYVITFAEVGNDVVATGAGTLNLTGLTFRGRDDSVGPHILPARGWTLIGGGSADSYFAAPSFSGSIGSGGQTIAAGSTGGIVGVLGTNNLLFVPTGYVSGTLTNGSSTFANASFQSLGLSAGTQIVTFNAGVNTDTITIVVPEAVAAIPEPATWAMMIGGFGLVGGSMRRHRRTAVSYT